MTLKEYLKSYWHLSESFRRYRRAYKNYFNIILSILRHRFPFKAVLRDGTELTINNYYEAYLTSFGILNDYSIKDNIITISKKDLPATVQLHLRRDNGDVHGVFFKEVYRFLPVEGKVVVDIGANIGDSSIYFALHGAKKIIALEPFPKNYEIAKENIELNKFQNKIILLLAGCSDKQKEITIDPKQEGAGSSLDETKRGTKIQLISLEQLVKKYDIPNSSVMKVDCEGCEYSVILSTPDSVLQKFSHIEIEYHYGYKNLKNKLERCGFHVSISSPLFQRNRQAGKSMYYGYLYAKKS